MTVYIGDVATAAVLREALEPLWAQERSTRGLGSVSGVTRTSRGMCVATSEALRLLDPSWRCVYGMVNREPHTWCERAGFVLDLTADQFVGYPAVTFAAGRPFGYVPDCFCGADHDTTNIMCEDEKRTAAWWAHRLEQVLAGRADAVRPVVVERAVS